MKLKVGDKVRIKEGYDGSGNVAIIDKIQEGAFTKEYVQLDRATDVHPKDWWHNETKFDLVVESKFKVGDRVELVDTENYNRQLEVGDKGTIIDVREGLNNPLKISFDRLPHWEQVGSEESVKIVTQPKFEVGDRVEVARNTNHYDFGKVGYTGVVRKLMCDVTNGFKYSIGFDLDNFENTSGFVITDNTIPMLISESSLELEETEIPCYTMSELRDIVGHDFTLLVTED